MSKKETKKVYFLRSTVRRANNALLAKSPEINPNSFARRSASLGRVLMSGEEIKEAFKMASKNIKQV